MARWGIGRQSLGETSWEQPGGPVPSVALTQSTEPTNSVGGRLTLVTCMIVFKIAYVSLCLKPFPKH